MFYCTCLRGVCSVVCGVECRWCTGQRAGVIAVWYLRESSYALRCTDSSTLYSTSLPTYFPPSHHHLLLPLPSLNLIFPHPSLPTQSLPSSSRPYRDQKDSFDPPLASSSNPDFLPGTLIPYDMYRRYRGLLEQKRELKRELKAYDEQFARDYGRTPKKTDKEVCKCVWCV